MTEKNFETTPQDGKAILNRTHALAQLLVSCWVLSGDDQDIPTPHGIFDNALKKACDKGAFPEWARESLHFVESNVGIRCVESLRILAEAQSSDLSRAWNPSYNSVRVQITPSTARILLNRLHVGAEDARKWGQVLREALEEEHQATKPTI